MRAGQYCIMKSNCKHLRQNGLNAKLLYDATHRFSLLWQFWRSKILSCLTFGRKHTHYKRKRKAFKQRLKAIKQLAG